MYRVSDFSFTTWNFHTNVRGFKDMTSNGVTALARDPEWEDWALCKCPFEILYLIELRHVSPAGWQPVFCVGDMKE